MTRAANLAEAAGSGFAFRNRIINGDMRIDQRSAGASVAQISTAAFYHLDRWLMYGSVTNKLTIKQNAGSVTPPPGFVNYLGLTSNSSYFSASGDAFIVGQVIEGYNVADFNWGTSNASAVTLSFWVRSSLTGTFSGSVYNKNGSRAISFSYSIAAANTWEYKTVTIPGDTTGTWLTNNDSGLQLFFNLGSGSSLLSTPGAWSSTYTVGATGSQSIVGTNGATWYVTGVQLEKGSVATPFEFRPYGAELALCQRYAFVLRGDVNNLGYARCPIFGRDTAASGALWYPTYPVAMRAVPSLITSNFNSANVEIYSYTNAGNYTLSSVSLAEGSANSGQVALNTSTAMTAGGVASWRWTGTPNAYIGFSAEL